MSNIITNNFEYNHHLQVTFEGIVGSSYTGDIAIDSLEITEGNCPGETHMIFNHSMYVFFKNIAEDCIEIRVSMSGSESGIPYTTNQSKN